MNKTLFFFIFLAISLGYIFEVDKVIARNFNHFETLKNFYIETILSIQETREKYFNQVNTIKELQEQNKELRNYKLLYQASKNELDSILQTINNPNSVTEQIKFAKVLSYIDFNDYTKVWLDLKKEDNSILGLISDNYAAGIVVNQNGSSKALLNGNEKCNYAIFIGKDKAPGIIHPSKNAHTLIAKFIPIWFDIKEGDEVITSGMDSIFFQGLKVGRVISIKKMQDIQEATIEPYAKVLKQKHYFVYKRIDPLEKEAILTDEESLKNQTTE